MKRILLSVLTVLLVSGFAAAQSDLQAVALVKLTKTEAITVKQLKVEVQKLETQYSRALTVDERRQVLDIMINERLALQAAERDDVTVSDGELNQQLQQSRDAMAQALGRKPTDAEFNAAMKAETGLEPNVFKEQLRRQLIVQKYLLTSKQSLFESIKAPTEEEIVEQYELNKIKFIRPDTVRFSMIFVPIGTDTASRAKNREFANKLASDIGSSASKFDEAILKAQTPNSGYEGGDGGYLPKTQDAQKVVGQEFMNVAFSLKQGDVSQLLENPKGFQIIKITETYSQKLLELDDIQQLGVRLTVREHIANVLFQQKQASVLETASKQLVEELRSGTPFQVYEQNLSW